MAQKIGDIEQEAEEHKFVTPHLREKSFRLAGITLNNVLLSQYLAFLPSYAHKFHLILTFLY